MTNIQKQLDTGINNLINHCVKDYERWSTSNGTKELSNYSSREIERNLGMHVKKGSKYIKVMKDYGNGQRSVWGFIVASENDKKFQVGDILMAAGWRGQQEIKQEETSCLVTLVVLGLVPNYL